MATVSRWCARNGIVAESPQDLHWQIRGLGAESPVPARSAGMRPKHDDRNSCAFILRNRALLLLTAGIFHGKKL
jgi:hypothetical protein